MAHSLRVQRQDQSIGDLGPSSTDAAVNIVLKLRSLRSKIKTWNRSEVENILMQKNDLLARIKHLDGEEEGRSLLGTELEERTKIKDKLDLLVTQEEIL